MPTKAPRTLFEKIWDTHVVRHLNDGHDLIYIDRHLVHEVTSPQAFEGLRAAHRNVRARDLTLAVADHNVPTIDRGQGIKDPESKLQVETLTKNCNEFGIDLFDMSDARQGIVHVIGPEQGFTLPDTTIVCGDSHTATHGAFGALAFGIGTSQVEHVLATQTLSLARPKTMRIVVDESLPEYVSAKDLILHIIGQIGTAGGTGYVIEYAGKAFSDLSMEGRMTVCNMTIEAGARAGLIAPDEKTFEYLKGKPMAPKGDDWEKAIEHWKSLPSDKGATYDKEIIINAGDIAPTVTWGTSPEHTAPITACVPHPRDDAQQRALDYMGLTPDTPLCDIKIDKVFIGSCTNARIEDVRAAAAIAKGKRVAANVKLAMVVPGSGLVKAQAESEGLDKILTDAGFEWRDAGCSMCLAMNADRLEAGERCASTSNRNFEGRQGKGGLTHLMSPAMAAGAAIAGHLTDIRKF